MHIGVARRDGLRILSVHLDRGGCNIDGARGNDEVRCLCLYALRVPSAALDHEGEGAGYVRIDAPGLASAYEKDKACGAHSGAEE